MISESPWTVLRVPRNWALGAGEAADGGKGGVRETGGALSREPIRWDEERVEREAFERLKAELQHAFAAPEEFESAGNRG